VPYTSNPVFSDGNILSASQLAVLADNIEFLYSLTSGVHIPFTSETLTVGGDSRNWAFRRQARYLHYKIRSTQNDTDKLRIFVNGNVELDDGTNRIGPHTWESYIDLTGITAVPALGAFYVVYAEFTSLTGPNEWVVDYFLESDSTTL
jgi:hypothetical protein